MYWGIDMNKAHQVYFDTYSHIESIDNLITNCHMKYRCWKYWNPPIIYVMYLVAVFAYDVYLEVE